MRVGLPSYAFQRERFWLESGGGVGDVAAVGLASAGHPLLGAAVGFAEGEGWVFTGRFRSRVIRGLADHVVLGVVLLPGTAFVEFALHVGGQVGCPVVRELTLEAPLVLEEGAGVQVQVLWGSRGRTGSAVGHVLACRRWDGVVDGYGAGVDATCEWRASSWGSEREMASRGGACGRGAADARRECGRRWAPQPLLIDGMYERLRIWGWSMGRRFRVCGVWAAWGGGLRRGCVG